MPNTEASPSPTPEELRRLPVAAAFRAAFGAEAQQRRRQAQEREQRQRLAIDDLNRRRAYLASLRDPAGEPSEAES